MPERGARAQSRAVVPFSILYSLCSLSERTGWAQGNVICLGSGCRSELRELGLESRSQARGHLESPEAVVPADRCHLAPAAQPACN